MAFVLTRIHVDDYDAWKPTFDTDEPGIRRSARGHRILRNVEDPAEVFVLVEYATSAEAAAGRQRLLDSGVLNRFPKRYGPTLVEEAEVVTYS